MGFKAGNPGCSCCSCGTLTITVDTCLGFPVSGATVVVKRPDTTTLFTGTSDGSGQVSVPFDVSGTHSVEVTPSDTTYYQFTTSSVSLTCGSNTSAFVVLTVQTGYVCCDPCGTGYSLLGTTLYVTDGNGTTTLTYNSGTGNWSGSITVFTVCPPEPNFCADDDTTMTYRFNCTTLSRAALNTLSGICSCSVLDSFGIASGDKVCSPYYSGIYRLQSIGGAHAQSPGGDNITLST